MTKGLARFYKSRRLETASIKKVPRSAKRRRPRVAAKPRGLDKMAALRGAGENPGHGREWFRPKPQLNCGMYGKQTGPVEFALDRVQA
jgi:hypothetical protein